VQRLTGDAVLLDGFLASTVRRRARSANLGELSAMAADFGGKANIRQRLPDHRNL